MGKAAQLKLSGPAARRTKVIAMFQKVGGDRATAACNELCHKDQTGLDQLLATTPDDKAPRAIQKLLTKYKIPWAHEHQRRKTSANAVTDGEATSKDKRKV